MLMTQLLRIYLMLADTLRVPSDCFAAILQVLSDAADLLLAR